MKIYFDNQLKVNIVSEFCIRGGCALLLANWMSYYDA